MKPRHKRLTFILVGLAGVAVAVALVLNAFRSNIVFAFSPSEVVAGKVPEGHSFRLGGLVKKGSLVRDKDGLTVHFVVTDLAQNVNVTYKGILPDLFKEGTGAVSLGKMGPDGVFHAQQVLAKHDEKYMPPEAAEALKEAKKEKAQGMPVTMNEKGGSI
ncbi:MAG: cytochrome c maturation protein CcmE [Gammaproteobacteria bacterium]|jgi:cytochrome c-type biogenesis protein CcmE